MINKPNCFIFTDPRDWTRDDLHNWLKDMQNKYSIKDIKLDRFLMNGRALVLNEGRDVPPQGPQRWGTPIP